MDFLLDPGIRAERRTHAVDRLKNMHSAAMHLADNYRSSEPDGRQDTLVILVEDAKKCKPFFPELDEIHVQAYRGEYLMRTGQHNEALRLMRGVSDYLGSIWAWRTSVQDRPQSSRDRRRLNTIARNRRALGDNRSLRETHNWFAEFSKQSDDEIRAALDKYKESNTAKLESLDDADDFVAQNLEHFDDPQLMQRPHLRRSRSADVSPAKIGEEAASQARSCGVKNIRRRASMPAFNAADAHDKDISRRLAQIASKSVTRSLWDHTPPKPALQFCGDVPLHSAHNARPNRIADSPFDLLSDAPIDSPPDSPILGVVERGTSNANSQFFASHRNADVQTFNSKKRPLDGEMFALRAETRPRNVETRPFDFETRPLNRAAHQPSFAFPALDTSGLYSRAQSLGTDARDGNSSTWFTLRDQ